MNKKGKIEQEVKKTLEQFEKAEQRPPNPFFYSKLKALLDERRKQQNVFSVIFRPVLVISLVVINMGTALWFCSSGNGIYQIDTRQELLKILSGDLELSNQQINLFSNE